MDRDTEFSEYMAARWSPLCRAAILLGYSRTDAEDLVQTALATCYRSWPRVRRADNLDAYVYRVLMNTHASSRRRSWWGESPREHVPESAQNGDEDRVGLEDAVQRALGHLSQVNRSVVVLRFFAHLSERETAEALGIALGTAKSRLSRALGELAASEHLMDLKEGYDR
jgi:RNA polymerase sigma-70 factor (sigma-E family)